MDDHNGQQDAEYEDVRQRQNNGDGDADAHPQRAAGSDDDDRNWVGDHISDRHVLLNFILIFGAVFVSCVILLHCAAFAGRNWSADSLLFGKANAGLEDLRHPWSIGAPPQPAQDRNPENEQKDFWSQWHTLTSLNSDQANSTYLVY